ncbi:MAG: site-specific integrase [Methanosarcinales archaeon]|nr:site-specific integrase [Methanosarcinales archaeon]
MQEIDAFLTGIEAKPKTREAYKLRLNLFFNSLGIDARKLIDENNEDIRNARLPTERRVFHYLNKYNSFLQGKNYSANTYSGHKSTVRSFLNFYDIQIPNSFKKTKRARSLPENSNRFLQREQVKRILEHTTRVRNKAIVLIMATSGISRNEILNLKVGMVSFDENNIGTIKLRRGKVEHDYYTFISPEAIEILKEYWSERERTGKLKKDDWAFTTLDFNKQLSERAFHKMFQKINDKAGYEPGSKQNLSEIRGHALRKFFSSTMQRDGMVKDDVDWLLGHIPNHMDIAYFGDAEIERLKKEYIKHLPAIIFKEEIIIRSLSTEDAEKLAQQEIIIQNNAKELEGLKNAVKILLEHNAKKEAEEQRYLERHPEEFESEDIRPDIIPISNKSVKEIKEIGKNIDPEEFDRDIDKEYYRKFFKGKSNNKITKSEQSP